MTTEDKNNLLISFQRPDTGEIVIQTVPTLPLDDFVAASAFNETITADVQTNVNIDTSVPEGNVVYSLFIIDTIWLILLEISHLLIIIIIFINKIN